MSRAYEDEIIVICLVACSTNYRLAYNNDTADSNNTC